MQLKKLGTKALAYFGAASLAKRSSFLTLRPDVLEHGIAGSVEDVNTDLTLEREKYFY